MCESNSRRPGFLATVACGSRRVGPVRADIAISANLTPASGRQDHTASPSAPAAPVLRRHCVHRIPPRVRDDREPPL
jgi:hypothetical protein